jgi:hypothetical protein
MPAKRRCWTPEEDRYLTDNYLSQTRHEIAANLGRTIGSVRKRCSTLGLNHKHPALPEGVKAYIKQWYSEHSLKGDLQLDQLALLLGMDKANVCREARKMGLTDITRKLNKDMIGERAERQKRNIATNGHPRGMLGKHHSDDFKAKQSKDKKKWAANETPMERYLRTTKIIQTRIERYGTAGPSFLISSNPYSRTKSGKREDLNNQFFRSSWEANYARYLNFLIQQGEVASWEFEPKTFVFHGVERGQLTYTPDFKVVYPDGSYEWHEVKGWMDAKSKAKLKRMEKFYPDEKLIVIGADEYRALAKWSSLIDGWED